MIEASLFIGFSLVLFVYWFRYTVLLLLRQEQAERSDTSALGLFEVGPFGEHHEDVPLDRLHAALEQDYRMLCYLLEHAAGIGQRPVERFLLILDFRLLRIWYRITRNTSTNQARGALREMSAVIAHLELRMGQRAGVQRA